jgi:hypothetical protein
LVSKRWNNTAQRLLWRELYVYGGDEAMERWKAAEPNDGAEVRSLVAFPTVLGFMESETDPCSAEMLMALAGRCSKIVEYREEARDSAVYLRAASPIDFVDGSGALFFPSLPPFYPPFCSQVELTLSSIELRHLQLGGPCPVYQNPSKPLSRLTSLSLLQVAPNHLGDRDELFESLVKSYKAGCLPALISLRLDNEQYLGRLLPFAPALRTLHLPRLPEPTPYLNHLSDPPTAYDAFIACTSLEHLILDLYSPRLFSYLQPSVRRITLLNVSRHGLEKLQLDLAFKIVAPASFRYLELRRPLSEAEWEVGQLFSAAQTMLAARCDEIGVALLV